MRLLISVMLLVSSIDSYSDTFSYLFRSGCLDTWKGFENNKWPRGFDPHKVKLIQVNVNGYDQYMPETEVWVLDHMLTAGTVNMLGKYEGCKAVSYHRVGAENTQKTVEDFLFLYHNYGAFDTVVRYDKDGYMMVMGRHERKGFEGIDIIEPNVDIP